MGEDRGASVFPGLAVVLVLAMMTRFVHGLIPPEQGEMLGEVILGMGLGLILGNLIKLPDRWQPGIAFCFNAILRISIVLLGARFSLQKIVEIGGSVLLLIIGLITMAILLARTFCISAGASCKLGTLIGVGTAVCGNTAITVSAPLIHARDEEISFAIATNTLFGTFAVFFYPVFANYLGLSPEFFGIWAGTAVNDTSQVVAAGFTYGETAGDIAVAVKLTRNALLGFVLIAVGLIYAKEQTGEELTLTQKIRRSIPAFVIGFLCMALLNTFGFFEMVGELVDRDPRKDLTMVAKFMILVALIGVGLNTDLKELKGIGFMPFFIGLFVAGITSTTSYLVIRFLILAE